MGPDLVAMFDFNADETSQVPLNQIVLAHEGRSGTFSFQQQPAGSGGVFNIGHDFQLVPLPIALPAENSDPNDTRKGKGTKKRKDGARPTRPKKTRSGTLKVTRKSKTERNHGKSPKSKASSSKRGAFLNRARSTESRKKKAKVTVTAAGEEAANDEFLSTSLKDLFSWPRRMIETIFNKMSKPGEKIHIQQFSEFSGAGTAEFAMTALAAAAPDILSSRVMHQADWDNSASRALINNAEDDSHVFGDIRDICSEEMVRKTSRRVAVEVAICKLLPRLSFFLLPTLRTMKYESLVIQHSSK